MTAHDLTDPGLGWWSRLAARAARVRADLPLAALDTLLIVLTYAAMLLLRFDGTVPQQWWGGIRAFIPLAVVIHLAANWMWGLYGQMWRHASVQEARRILLAGATAGLAISVGLLGRRPVPMSVVVLGVTVTTMLVGLLRFQSRLFALRRHGPSGRRVLLVGATEAAGALIREMRRDDGAGLVPVAAVDDDPATHGRSLASIPVVGELDDLPDVAARFAADLVILAMTDADATMVRRVATLAERAGLTVKLLPSYGELVDDRVSMRDVRDIEISDLLGRQQVRTDLSSVHEALSGRCVLVTGAGGSIGSEIARQVASFGPGRLVLLDHDETHLFDAAARLDWNCDQALADIRDRSEMRAIFARYRPDVVFHAAAHKHVPLLESHPREAARTNVFGTQNVLQAASEIGVERFVLVSTDKAVRPSSVMGASKRVAEQLVLAQAERGGHYCAVRFGNVLGSRGSVVPTFMRQIREGGPVTVTDENMTRFFMSIPEAVQLVLQAAVMCDGREVFMLDMGEPVRILDLANRMIRLSGREPGVDIEVKVVGTRPGEKLEEELQAPDERSLATAHPKVFVLESPIPNAHEIEEQVERLRTYVSARDDVNTFWLLFDAANGRPVDIVLPGEEGDFVALPARANGRAAGTTVAGHTVARLSQEA